MLTKIRRSLVLCEKVEGQGSRTTANDMDGLIDVIHRNDGQNRSEDFTENSPLKGVFI
jgi:hypothetical protein